MSSVVFRDSFSLAKTGTGFRAQEAAGQICYSAAVEWLFVALRFVCLLNGRW